MRIVKIALPFVRSKIEVAVLNRDALRTGVGDCGGRGHEADGDKQDMEALHDHFLRYLAAHTSER